MSVDRKHLKKLFKQLADLLADEAEYNPEFEKALTEIFNLPAEPYSSKGEKDDGDLEIPDPFAAYSDKAPEEFEAWLKSLSVEQLRGMTRQHRFDSTGKSNSWKTSKKFVELITQRVAGRAKQGSTFRQYGSNISEEASPESTSSDKTSGQQSPSENSSSDEPVETSTVSENSPANKAGDEE